MALLKPANILLILASLAALSQWGCSKPARQEVLDGPPNVLLIVVDTLRADKLGCYGSALGATPRIDKLATEGVRFEQAYAHSPWTLPSFASLFTSLYPPQHGAGGSLGRFRGLPASRRTVAECFRDAGYATAAVINVDFLGASFGMTQGFEHVDFKAFPNNRQVRPATETTDAALAWLEQSREKPFFLLVHYFDPHLVYAPPEEYRRKFAAPEDRNNASWVFGTRGQISAYRQGRLRFDEATIRRAEKLYDGEVAYTDYEVGRLLDGLDEAGLTNRTITVFTSDHGEEFMDHGGFEHGHTLYQELVHVPLILRYSRQLNPGTVTAVVGQVDVAPTLCELAGVATDAAFVGKSLQPLVSGESRADRPVYLQGNFWGLPYQGWMQDGYKLIEGPGGAMLFNLRVDPGEIQELSSVEPERLQRIRDDMQLALRAMQTRGSDGTAPVRLSPAEQQRLEALGYLVPATQPASTAAPP